MSHDEIGLREKYLLGMIDGIDYRRVLIGHHKDQFAIEIAEAIMDRVNGQGLIGGSVQLKAQIQLLILDSIEFGIQLGGMDWKEGE